MIKYKVDTTPYTPVERTIVKVTVERETDKCVFMDGEKHGKNVPYATYCDTLGAACDLLAKVTMGRLKAAKGVSDAASVRAVTVSDYLATLRGESL